ncbi:hypothetical protein nbrc107696_16220 [Gordonia spumicola]|uniref:Uncharacterized protein n=1 Tax=Gordonia spumicola TaxID=589161 RepID=A0A7I9V702_9ACTN|nr:hypothetical protein [Gordonia spumicola]GEE01176.1 hypothetical protein nbrc107696_16220 [Gordonia spumicola]
MTSPYSPNPWDSNNGFQPGYPGLPLITIGDISCTQTQIVTPAGTAPVAGAQWHVTDMSHTTEEIPTWAIVCAIVGAFVVCLFSLFFLLVKERRTTGTVQVTVTSGGFMHTTSIPVYAPNTVMDVHNRVNYARSLSSAMQ